jgi:GT2 family glycosyltransferase
MYNCSDHTIRCAGGHVVLGSTYRKTIFGAGQNDTGQFQEPFEVNYVPGAFIMARNDVVRTLGGFRETFFMYFEDTDLCLRAQKIGYRVMVVPGAKVQHWDPINSVTDHHIEVHKIKNFLSIYTLHAQLWVLPTFFLRYVVLDLMRNLIVNPARARSVWDGLRRYWSILPMLLRQRYAN